MGKNCSLSPKGTKRRKDNRYWSEMEEEFKLQKSRLRSQQVQELKALEKELKKKKGNDLVVCKTSLMRI